MEMEPQRIKHEGILPPKLDLNVSSASHFYQSPGSSATSSLYSSRAPDISHSQRPLSKRKRHQPLSSSALYSARCDFPSGKPTSQLSGAEADVVQDHPSHTSNKQRIQSPVPLVSETNSLQSGPDTPTAALAHVLEIQGYSPVAHAHRGRNTNVAEDPSGGSYFPEGIRESALSKEKNGQSGMVTSPGLRDGLARAVYTVPFLAGKVWEFCRSSAFRGFFAGEGQGYEMRVCKVASDRAQASWHDLDEKDVRVIWRDESMRTPVPGGFPIEDYIPDYMSHDHTHASPPRATKRQHLHKDFGQLGDSWMIADTHRPVSRETSPSRLAMRKVPPVSPSTRRPASRLGRRPILPVSRPSSASRTSCAGSPGKRSDPSFYFASPRSQRSNSPSKHDSPVSEEVQRHATRLRRREMEEDANLKRMNQQMKALIKEGKEALGTKFEVDEENDAENDTMVEEGYG